MQISLEKSLVNNLMVQNHYKRYFSMGEELMQALENKKCPGNDFLGWMHLPSSINQAELDRINQVADKLQDNSDVVVVIGIGGSYLGARAVIESQKQTFGNNGCEILYAGHHLSPGYLSELSDYLKDKQWSIIVISKSGTTTEPAIAFRYLRNELTGRFGEDAIKERVVAITDQSKGALRQLADANDMESFVIPDDVGGRFSVFTPVGLLPIAVAGMDVNALIEGARDIEKQLWKSKKDNIALQYAAIRNALYQNGHTTEILVNYHHKFHYVAEWWKQLFGESEGKDGKGIFPASVDLTTDLHSMGQYIQDGLRNIFETVVRFENVKNDESIGHDNENLDNLNYLEGKTMDFVNKNALEGTMLAHNTGGVPNLILKVKDDSIKSIGSLLYFFMATCAISGLMLQVNPFNQPGVEDYKRNMFALLQKPGFEIEYKELQKLRNKLNF